MCGCKKRTIQEIEILAMKYHKATGKEIAIHNTFNKFDFCELDYAKFKGYKIIKIIDNYGLVYKY
jgi:hypothetical protein